MQITVLGSGQDGGLPQLGSDHPLDAAARRGLIPTRTGSSLLVEIGGARILLDASPDLRNQWAARSGLPDVMVVTHGHMGHYAGLVHFGKEAAAPTGLPLLVTPSLAAYLGNHEPWRTLVTGGYLDPRPGFDHRAETRIRLLPVPHRAEHTDTVAVSVAGEVLYLPDIDSWDAWPEATEVVAEHSVAFLDATFWSADEVPSRDLAEIPHPLVPDTLERFADMDTRIVLTHLNHTNPLCNPDSPETAEVTARGFEVAFDGLVISPP